MEKIFFMLQEIFEKLCIKLRPIQKNKDFEIEFPWKNKWPLHYITLQMKVGCEK